MEESGVKEGTCVVYTPHTTAAIVYNLSLIHISNTFGANRLKYDKDGELKAIVEAAIANARKAVEEAGRGYVALDLGPTGKLLKPLGDLPFETAVSLSLIHI